MGDWVNKVLYFHIMEHYIPMIVRKLSHMQQHGLNLSKIILSKRSDTKEYTLSDFN